MYLTSSEMTASSSSHLPYHLEMDVISYANRLAAFGRSWWLIHLQQEVALATYYSMVLKSLVAQGGIEDLERLTSRRTSQKFDPFTKRILDELNDILLQYTGDTNE